MADTDAPETVEVSERSVSCDGGGALGDPGVLGHPKVYLNMGGDSFVECPYCDRRFVLAPGAGQAG